ncbi:hypothetical protein FQN49_008100 [Arthroderma sp. PD_2]|nr:hypothetical protein FQN49_008100 [Arthroderma sp. PD_2]
MSNPFYSTPLEKPHEFDLPTAGDTSQTQMSRPDDVSEQRQMVLCTYISAAKEFLDPGIAVTEEELKRFLSLIFTGWTTDEPNYAPNKRDAEATFGEKHLQVGI